MRTVSIISQKGGAGKTTLAVHLGAAAARAGLIPVILDADPQATASRWCEWRQGAGQGDPDVIDCASPTLLGKKRQAVADAGAQFVVIDTPPHADVMSREACKLADLVLIPCRPQAFDLSAVETTADLARASGKPSFVVFMGGPIRAPGIYREAMELVTDSIGLAVAPFMLPGRAVYHHSTGAGLTALESEPGGKAAGEVADLWKWTCEQLNLSSGSLVAA